MVSGHRYRVVSVVGTVLASVTAVLIANLASVQDLLTSVIPIVRRLSGTVLIGDELTVAILTTVVVLIGSLFPLFKPRPRRTVDTGIQVQKRVIIAGFALATIGYFNYSYRLPRTTLAVTILVLFAVLPIWFVIISRRPVRKGNTVVIGDDIEEITEIIEAIEVPIAGYVAPPSPYYAEANFESEAEQIATDGSGESIHELNRLGGLSQLDEVFTEYDIDTVVLAFGQADRSEFFGTLHLCHDQGIRAMIHRKYSDTVLTSFDTDDPIVEVNLEPLDLQDRVLKRLFDTLFAGTALIALSPVFLLIVLAIKVEGNGPIFFSQTRTYEFGDTFQIYKFRTLKPEKGGEIGTTIGEDRKTPLGEFLRKTHLDEIPQLWSILVGDMSVVGPRPAQTELESEFESEASIWKQRWFVKPGLTGFAQINGATSQEPAEKIKYDVEYIQRQSFWLDLEILVRQFWQVFEDLSDLYSSEEND